MGQSLITVAFWSPYEALACHEGDPLKPPQGPSVTGESAGADQTEDVPHIVGTLPGAQLF